MTEDQKDTWEKKETEMEVWKLGNSKTRKEIQSYDLRKENF